MSALWSGEMFGFKSNGRHAIGYQYDDMPPEQKISKGDVVTLGSSRYEVTSVEPKPGNVFGEGLIQLTAERIDG